MILKCFYLLKGSQTLLLQSHAFEWSADKKKSHMLSILLSQEAAAFFKNNFKFGFIWPQSSFPRSLSPFLLTPVWQLHGPNHGDEWPRGCRPLLCKEAPNHVRSQAYTESVQRRPAPVTTSPLSPTSQNGKAAPAPTTHYHKTAAENQSRFQLPFKPRCSFN